MMDPSWQLYIPIFIGPFMQEDTAVIAAATLSAANHQHFPNVFLIVLVGLILSDAWKYWIGAAAHTNPKMRALADKKNVAAMGERIKSNAILTLITVRFVPFARIPSYIACGYFKVPYWKFLVSVVLSGALYVSIIFAITHYLSEIFGDKIEIILLALGVMLLILMTIIWLVKNARKKTT
ncbi:MAG: VTT domain-containing protein [Litorimonas sp.]